MFYYELAFLTPNLEIREREKFLKKINDEIKKLNGKIEEQFIEKKIFAYPVKKHLEGFLGVIIFEMEPEKIKELSQFLKMEGNILRTLLEKKEKKEKEAHPKKIRRKPFLEETKKKVKKEKVKIEELDKKLDELLK
ncbi:MAG TPA: 30S ribosomal protein S6 [Candidatus Pacearchaeota archaeon]|nr:30S ribosomal protein S6 [Candidatus Pacearchaeota archaeon]HOK94124.1 30S ribosomal protein S6 [Candidatus Pacearchaeota archaeon]HPO75252.1 30S ribosomal protein S6 [Candidatus Pacearchaeota archaeon]